MNEGVEWAMHSCVNLSWVAPERAVTAAKLAAFYELPTAYLNKQLQALARADILTSTPGPRGGFRLARPAERITLMDVVTAIEGPDEAFRCTEIRRQGPNADARTDNPTPCLIDEAMRHADLAWRRELAARTIADIRDQVEARAPGRPDQVRNWFENARV
ncbi:RrF2 family transcriptional regulator [Streptodolium elevatio]|uniref:Rrf2 family transcriptional regulator n=1 Tax=Streptodolium elevatio TaxID=3157996 RepID=A0ABV3DSX5_9ACTN